MSFGLLIRKSAATCSDNTAVICGDRIAGYGELYERPCRLAQALAGLDLAAGERVALLTGNCSRVQEIKVGSAVGA